MKHIHKVSLGDVYALISTSGFQWEAYYKGNLAPKMIGSGSEDSFDTAYNIATEFLIHYVNKGLVGHVPSQESPGELECHSEAHNAGNEEL